MSEKVSKKKKNVSQKDYLKKYLSGGKKQKDKVKIQKRVQIIDDNIDCVDEDIDTYQGSDNNVAGFDPTDEFAPQIVGVVDDRPKDVKILDLYKNKNRWKRVGEDSDIEEETTKIDQVQKYVEKINKSTLNDLLNSKKVNEEIENNIPIKRDRKTGRKRDLKKEKEDEMLKEEKLKEYKEKYAVWGKGVKQVQDAQEQHNYEIREMQKPLARYADDQDLEEMLKSKVRDGDPMLDYIRKNKKDDDDSPDGVRHEIKMFRGFCPPNRFGILPGHKWDGVDRSNGYESRWLLQLNSKKSLEDEAYKWSSSDL
ncbi:BUD13 homolog [Daktulosphaira vitifoliae]|uniref:BUD13 homolog n=1 Tax=Daktulosphaira vitifoliae TaxID=58002 RepID=UPI0021AA478B|nr:BUD13 homolog [Daktulosphaira vitifoliae]